MLSFYGTCLVFAPWRSAASRPCRGFSIIKSIRYIKEELLIARHILLSRSSGMIAKMENLAGDGGRRTGNTDRILLQPGWTLHLPYDGCKLPRPGQQDGKPCSSSSASSASCSDLERCGRRYGLGLYRSRRHPCIGGHHSVASIALIPRIDCFMSEARHYEPIGNGVATVVVANWEAALDQDRLHRPQPRTDAEADEPEFGVKVEDDVVEAGGLQPLRAELICEGRMALPRERPRQRVAAR